MTDASPTPPPTLDMTATNIKSSPYDDPLNFLNLCGLDTQSRLFALALTQFNAIRFDYATADYMISFNFNIIFDTLRHLCSAAGIEWKHQDFYVVIFRSQLRQGADRARLGQLDQMSHQEACASGGLLHYWFGSPDGEMRNLATCKSSLHDDRKLSLVFGSLLLTSRFQASGGIARTPLPVVAVRGTDRLGVRLV